MKIKFFTTLVIGLTFNYGALAQENLNSETSIYDNLGLMFKDGKAPDLKASTVGVWSGRCFEKSNPNEAISAGITIREKKSNPSIYEMANYWDKSQPANYFDDKSLEALADDLAAVYFNEIKIKKNSAVTKTLQLSQYGNFLIEKTNARSDDKTRCYYSKVK